MAELDFALSIHDISELVESFVYFNNTENVKLCLTDRGRKGHPEPDWINAFMKQNNLSLKEATKLSVACYNATKNLFVIYQIYDILEKTLTQLGIKNCLDLVRNCDESGLPRDPKKCNVISERGQNTMVITASSAAGEHLLPM